MNYLAYKGTLIGDDSVANSAVVGLRARCAYAMQYCPVAGIGGVLV